MFARKLVPVAWLTVLLTAVAVGQPPDPAADLKVFHAGVQAIGVNGLPGPVAVFGPRAFAVAADADPAANPVAAAARLGKGRVVVLGHEGFFAPDSLQLADTRRFVSNCLTWAGQAETGRVRPRFLVRGMPALAKELAAQNVPAATSEGKLALPRGGPGLVLVAGVNTLTAADLPAVQAFVTAGGGLVTGAPGWGWLTTHPGQSLDKDLPVNQLLAAAGLAVADGTTKKAGDQYPVARPPAVTNADAAVAVLEKLAAGTATPSDGDGERIRAAVGRLVGAAPEAAAGPLLARAAKAAAALAARVPVPRAKAPVKAGDAQGRMLLGLTTALALQTPPDAVRPHPAAAEFPGAVPADAPRVSRKVTLRIDHTGFIAGGVGTNPRADVWHGTGLYAAPGEAVTVTLPPAAVGKGLAVRVGCHSDTLWSLTEWKRGPAVSRLVPAASAVTRTANPFGGLVYVVAPVGLKLGEVEVTVAGAVEAVRYVHGKTTPAEWAALRTRSAPWAEFETDKVVLTVPAADARKVDDPAALMSLWDQYLDACADLSCRDRVRGRPERVVHDVQISAGFMHSGYPIMAHLVSVPEGLDAARMARDGAWGYLHELGHNHQDRAWTFAGTVEVTCNLYALYGYKQLLPAARLHDAIGPDAVRRNTAKYRQGGRKFDDWQKDPFLALVMYKQLADEFGWDAYKTAFTAYQKLPPADVPKTEEAKRDMWLVQMSRATGRNLAPFFDDWGIPVTDAAKRQVAGLPEWKFPDAAR